MSLTKKTKNERKLFSKIDNTRRQEKSVCVKISSFPSIVQVPIDSNDSSRFSFQFSQEYIRHKESVRWIKNFILFIKIADTSDIIRSFDLSIYWNRKYKAFIAMISSLFFSKLHRLKLDTLILHISNIQL